LTFKGNRFPPADESFKKRKMIYSCGECGKFSAHTKKGCKNEQRNLFSLPEVERVKWLEDDVLVKLRQRSDLGIPSDELTKENLLGVPLALPGEQLSNMEKLLCSVGRNYAALLIHGVGHIAACKLTPGKIYKWAQMISAGEADWGLTPRVPEEVKGLVDEPDKPAVVAPDVEGEDEHKPPEGRHFTFKTPMRELADQSHTLYGSLMRGGGEGTPPDYLPLTLMVPPDLIPDLYALLASHTIKRKYSLAFPAADSAETEVLAEGRPLFKTQPTQVLHEAEENAPSQ